jgi:hypothetical protein
MLDDMIANKNSYKENGGLGFHKGKFSKEN